MGEGKSLIRVGEEQYTATVFYKISVSDPVEAPGFAEQNAQAKRIVAYFHAEHFLYNPYVSVATYRLTEKGLAAYLADMRRVAPDIDNRSAMDGVYIMNQWSAMVQFLQQGMRSTSEAYAHAGALYPAKPSAVYRGMAELGFASFRPHADYKDRIKELDIRAGELVRIIGAFDGRLDSAATARLLQVFGE